MAKCPLTTYNEKPWQWYSFAFPSQVRLKILKSKLPKLRIAVDILCQIYQGGLQFLHILATKSHFAPVRTACGWIPAYQLTSIDLPIQSHTLARRLILETSCSHLIIRQRYDWKGIDIGRVMTNLNRSLWVHPSVKYLENNRAMSSFGFYNTPATIYAIFTASVSIGHHLLLLGAMI